MINLKNMKLGTKLFGRIINTEFKESNIYIVSINKEELTAYSELDFIKNEKVFLEVIAEGKQPKLKLQKASDINALSEFPESIRILKTCNIEVNKENIITMNEYLQEENPIQLDKIFQYFKQKKLTEKKLLI